MNIESKIRKAILSLIKEQAKPEDTEEKPDQAAQDPAPASPKDQPQPAQKPDKPKPGRKKSSAEPGSINIAPGSVGKGRFKSFIGEAEARSVSEPEKLMKDLGIESAAGSTDVDKIKSIIQRAINFNPIMASAYAGATGVKVKIGENTAPTAGIKVFTSELSTRDGIKFISHTLSGAKNAGALSLTGAIEIGLHDGEIFIREI